MRVYNYKSYISVYYPVVLLIGQMIDCFSNSKLYISFPKLGDLTNPHTLHSNAHTINTQIDISQFSFRKRSIVGWGGGYWVVLLSIFCRFYDLEIPVDRICIPPPPPPPSFAFLRTPNVGVPPTPTSSISTCHWPPGPSLLSSLSHPPDPPPLPRAGD